MRRSALALSALAAVALAAGCGGSGGASGGGGGSGSGTPVKGGTLRAGIPDNPDYLDPGLSYTNEGWEILEATNNGLLTFKKAAGGAGAQIVPDIASAMPTVTDGGLTYTFHVRPNVMFSPPVSRPVKPSDFKFSIERLFRIDSGGLAFFTGIKGADAYAKTRKGGIAGFFSRQAYEVLVEGVEGATATFTASHNSLNVVLNSTQANPISDAQELYGIFFTLSDTPSSDTLASSSGTLIDIAANGTFTLDGGTIDIAGELDSTGTSFITDATIGAATSPP